MDIRVGSSLKRRKNDTNDEPSKARRLDTDGVQSLEAPWLLSRPNGAEISMRNASAAPSVALHSFACNDFRHLAIDQALQAELEGKWIPNVPIDDFIQAAFPDTYPRVFKSLPLNQYKGYIAAVEQYLRIARVAKDRSEIYDSFAFLVNYVATARFAHTKMVLLGGHSVKGGVDRRVPACIVCTQGVGSSHVSWEDMLVPVYFTATRAEPQPKGSDGVINTPRRVGKSGGKSRVASTKRSPAAVQLKPHEVLAGYALEILSASGLRQHAIAILVECESVSLWYFDHSGVISSTKMDLKAETDQKMFYRVLGMLGCASRAELGYVRRLCPSAGWPSTENAGSLLLWDRDGESRNWDLANLKKLNIGSRGLIGRGTTVYSFGDDVRNSDAPFALKLSWQPTSRPSEAEFFIDAQKAGVEGVPRVLAMDCLASLSDGIRSRLPLSSSPWEGQTERELRALVFDRVCRPLNEFPIMERPLDFLNIFKQLITIHYNLCSRAHMLHRDISPNNLMWASGGSDGTCVRQSSREKQHGQPSGDVGYLIDLDFAAIAEAGTAEQIDIEDLPHTLALPFLAIDHLPPDAFIEIQSPFTATMHGRHVYRHDLESFFWSLWWILLNTVRDTFRGKRDTASIDDVLSDWRLHDLSQNREAKKGFLQRYKGFSAFISERLWPKYEHHRVIMESFLNNMSSTIVEGHIALEEGRDYKTAGGYITYENVLRVFPENDKVYSRIVRMSSIH